MKGIMWFEKKGKLNPRYVGPFEITKQVGKVAYKQEFSVEMSVIHNIFHVSMLKKYIPVTPHLSNSFIKQF